MNWIHFNVNEFDNNDNQIESVSLKCYDMTVFVSLLYRSKTQSCGEQYLLTCQPVPCPSIWQPVWLHTLPPAAQPCVCEGPHFLSYVVGLLPRALLRKISPSYWLQAPVPSTSTARVNNSNRKKGREGACLKRYKD